eukprot:jgi/Picsp_1/2904/NSC_01129-R1_protein spinster homolog 1-like
MENSNESKIATRGILCPEHSRVSRSSNGVNAEGLSREFGLTLFQDGLLPAAFMVGLLVSSPIFAESAKYSKSFRLIGIGLSVWATAVAGCAVSVDFWSLLCCRMVVGVGEASFVALAAPFIDDCAPKEQKTSWLAIFYLCIPVGYAFGFLYGGIMANLVGWRAAFLLEALAMVPFIVFHFTSDVQLKKANRNEEPDSEPRQKTLGEIVVQAWRDVVDLCRYPLFLFTTLGMTCYTAVIGSYAFYGPLAGKDAFHVEPKSADMLFGVITVITGILGTLSGGIALDKMGSSMRNAATICSGSMLLGAVVIIVAFLTAPSFGVFALIFSIGEFLLFVTQAPSNALILWSVPPQQRALAISLSVVSMHLFGDVPMPPLLGLLQGQLGNWRITMSIAAVVIILGGILYGAATKASQHAVDYRYENNNNNNNEDDQDGESAPLRGTSID